MTRINMVPPRELTDQHLIAEWRELRDVPNALRRALRTRAPEDVARAVPATFTLGKGHISFFYDKGAYLALRATALGEEMECRGFRPDYDKMARALRVWEDHPSLRRTFRPSSADLSLVRTRIRERIAMKPNWYRYCGAPYSD